MHDIERQALPEFFSGRLPSKTEAHYRQYRWVVGGSTGGQLGGQRVTANGGAVSVLCWWPP